MNDLFYLTTHKINLSDIIQFSENLENYIFSGDKVCVQINVANTVFHFQQMFPHDFPEEADQNFIIGQDINSIFCISHRSKDLNLLTNYMKAIMAKWNGYLGNDDEEFEPYYKFTEIEQFAYSE